MIENPIIEIGNDPSKIQRLPIKECGETLVEVTSGTGIFVSPQYYERGIRTATNQMLVREGVFKALQKAQQALPKNIHLLLWDGFRTLKTQAALFEDAQESLLNDEQVELYLAKPPESETDFHLFPPPHTTGGAIDLTLCDASGTPLDMGADFDEFREIAWLAYFEGDRSAIYGESALTYQKNRRQLYWAMRTAGFAPYPWEFWHYELGTIVAANFFGLSTAQYGAIADA